MKSIQTDKAPLPGGHYSQAIVHNGLVYVSGQLPVDPKTGGKQTGSIEEQTRLVLQNLAAILEASDSSLNKVLKVTVYISDISLWGKVNEVYAGIFGDHRPARAIVPTRDLHFGFTIELDAVAAID
jgi:2-iminobutanoate/2-iminopropanoate deaminase